MRSLDSGHEEYIHACFLSKQGREGDRGKQKVKQEDGFAVGSQKAGQVVT